VVTWKQHLAETPAIGAIRRRQLSAKRAFRDAKASARRQGFLEAVELAKKLEFVDDSRAQLLLEQLEGKKRRSRS
jgi:hypothetical protein